MLFYVYWSTADLLEHQTDETIRSEVQGLAEQYRHNGLPGVADRSAAAAEENQGISLFTIRGTAA